MGTAVRQYGSTAVRHDVRLRSRFKELIQEKFGDGLMCAIDFRMEIGENPIPQGIGFRLL